MCLCRGMMFYAWDNLELPISPFDFEFDGLNYSLTDGNYSITTLEAKIKEQITNGGGNADDFKMKKDYPSGKIVITLTNASTFTPESEALANMIGFALGVQISGITYGDELPNFEGKNTRIFITNSLLLANATTIQNRLEQILYEVHPPHIPAYCQFNMIDTPEEFVWMRMSTNTIFSMNFSVINQNLEPVDLNGTNVKYWVLIRESPNNLVEIEKGQNNIRP